MLTYPLAIEPGVEVAIEGGFPLTEAQWAQMLRVLDVMKPGLVADDARDQNDDSGYE